MKSSTRPSDDELDRLVKSGIARHQVEPGDDCLDAEVLASYADGGLSAEERVSADAHLAECRDCRRALALMVESDSAVGAGIVATPAVADAVAMADATFGPRASTGSPRRSGLMKIATTWLPLAAALVVATGLWFAFARPRQQSPSVASSPAHLDARNDSAATQGDVPPAAAQARAASPTVPADASSADRVAAPGEPASAAAVQERLQPAVPGVAAPSWKPSSSRGDADAAAPQAPALGRARGAFREESAAARPKNEADSRAAAAPAPASPPPPSPAALADAAPARPAVAAAGAEQQSQATVAGQLAQAAPAAPVTAAPMQQAAAGQNAAVNQNAAPNQNASVNATQQQYAVNQQQTGPSANLNIAPAPAPKADERRQADAAKRATNDKAAANASAAKPSEFGKPAAEPTSVARQAEAAKRDASENAAARAPSAKPAELAKAADEPKSLARAKAAAESPAAPAPVDAVSARTESANAASARKIEAEAATSGAGRPAAAANAQGGDTASRTRTAGASGAAEMAAGTSTTSGAGARASAPATAAASPGAASNATAGGGAGNVAAGARAADGGGAERGIAESVAITAGRAPGPVLRSADGMRWWRVRAPSTIEGSRDRGASWTVEYSEPSARIAHGAATTKGGCWMIGANGLVLRTRPDGGWERVAQPTTRDLAAVTPYDHRVATVTDDQGRTYRTTDGGATWR